MGEGFIFWRGARAEKCWPTTGLAKNILCQGDKVGY